MSTYVSKAQIARCHALDSILMLKDGSEVVFEGVTYAGAVIPAEIDVLSVTLADSTGTYTLTRDLTGGITECQLYGPEPVERPAQAAAPGVEWVSQEIPASTASGTVDAATIAAPADPAPAPVQETTAAAEPVTSAPAATEEAPAPATAA